MRSVVTKNSSTFHQHLSKTTNMHGRMLPFQQESASAQKSLRSEPWVGVSTAETKPFQSVTGKLIFAAAFSCRTEYTNHYNKSIDKNRIRNEIIILVERAGEVCFPAFAPTITVQLSINIKQISRELQNRGISGDRNGLHCSQIPFLLVLFSPYVCVPARCNYWFITGVVMNISCDEIVRSLSDRGCPASNSLSKHVYKIGELCNMAVRKRCR